MLNLDAHHRTLKDRHSALDQKIISAAAVPGSDDLTTSQMKRHKLALRDRMEGIA